MGDESIVQKIDCKLLLLTYCNVLTTGKPDGTKMCEVSFGDLIQLLANFDLVGVKISFNKTLQINVKVVQIMKALRMCGGGNPIIVVA